MSLWLVSTQSNRPASAYGFGGFFDLGSFQQVDAGQRHQKRGEARGDQQPAGCPSESDNDQRQPNGADER
jgi:hypothetical protein